MLILILCYSSIVIFIIASIFNIVRQLKMPVHLRWELYPVPHEKGRSEHGGSKLEEFEWWNKEHEKDEINEIKEMGKEILFLKAVWEYNKSLWLGSFPFHFGLYMMITNMMLLAISGILQLNGYYISQVTEGFGYYYFYLVTTIAWVAAFIGVFGAIRLFFSRVIDSSLKLHSSLSHYFNIILIGSIFATSLFWLIIDGNYVEKATNFYAAIFSFGVMPDLPAIAIWHILLIAFFIIYLPFTHMSHMYMKYFLYHYVRWDDEDVKKGSKLSYQLIEQLNYPVHWSAEHIGANGKKTWGDVVTDIPEEKK